MVDLEAILSDVFMKTARKLAMLQVIWHSVCRDLFIAVEQQFKKHPSNEVSRHTSDYNPLFPHNSCYIFSGAA